MKAEQLTKEETVNFARKHLTHLERQKEASAKRRAKLEEQGKKQITLMVSIKWAEEIKAMIKKLEELDIEHFGLVGLEPDESGKLIWTMKYKTK